MFDEKAFLLRRHGEISRALSRRGVSVQMWGDGMRVLADIEKRLDYLKETERLSACPLRVVMRE